MSELSRIMHNIVVVASILFLQLAHADSKSAPPMHSASFSIRPAIVIGASYAAGWGAPALPGLRITNKGVGGEESSAVLARFAKDALAAKPQVVIIWGHFNDIVRAPVDRRAQAALQAQQNYRTMTEMARQAGIEVMLATEITLPIGDDWKEKLAAVLGSLRGKEDYRKAVNRHIKAVNEWLREYAQQNKLILLDFERALASENGSRKVVFAQKDGSHISEAGYAALTEYAYRKLAQR